MNCNCGRTIEEKVVEVFGNASICRDCASISLVARKAAAAIQIIISDLYALKGEDGMASLKKQLSPTIAQFGLK